MNSEEAKVDRLVEQGEALLKDKQWDKAIKALSESLRHLKSLPRAAKPLPRPAPILGGDVFGLGPPPPNAPGWEGRRIRGLLIEAYCGRGRDNIGKEDFDEAEADFSEAISVRTPYDPVPVIAYDGKAALAVARTEKRLHTHLAKFQKGFDENFIRFQKEQEREREYSERLDKTESRIRQALAWLGALVLVVYTALFCAVLWANKWEFPEGFLPFGFLGLVFPTALLASPLAWWIRTLLRDKAKYAILREDAARKQRVMEYAIISSRDARNPVVLKSLDHWMNQSAADLLVDFENKRGASPAPPAPEVKLSSGGDKK